MNDSAKSFENQLRQSNQNLENIIRQNSERLFRELESSQKDYTTKLSDSVNKMSEQIYKVDQAVEKALDDALRQFALKVTDICTYAIQTAQTAYQTANAVKEEVKNNGRE